MNNYHNMRIKLELDCEYERTSREADVLLQTNLLLKKKLMHSRATSVNRERASLTVFRKKTASPLTNRRFRWV